MGGGRVQQRRQRIGRGMHCRLNPTRDVRGRRGGLSGIRGRGRQCRGGGFGRGGDAGRLQPVRDLFGAVGDALHQFGGLGYIGHHRIVGGQGEFDAPVRLAPGIGVIPGDGLAFAVAARGGEAGVDAAFGHRLKDGLRAAARQFGVERLRALRIGMAADLDAEIGAILHRRRQPRQRRRRIAGDHRLVRLEPNLGFLHRRVQAVHAFDARGQPQKRVHAPVIADRQFVMRPRPQTLRQPRRRVVRGPLIARNPGDLDQIGGDRDHAPALPLQGLKRGDDAQGPALGDGLIGAQRAVDMIEPRPRKAFDRVPHPLIGDASAQGHAPRIDQRRELGRAGFRIARLFMLGGQRKGLRQAGLEPADRLVKGGAFHIGGREQRHIRARDRHRPRTKRADGRDRRDGGIRPAGRGRPEAQRALRALWRARPLRGGKDAGAGGIGIGGAGIETRPRRILDKAQGKGRDDRARRGDIQRQGHIGGLGAVQRMFQIDLLLRAVGDRADRDLARRDRDLGPLGQFGGLQAKAQGGLPAVGYGVIGGFQQVGDIAAAGLTAQPRGHRLAIQIGRDKADDRDAVIIAQQFDLEIGLGKIGVRRDLHVVHDAPGIHDRLGAGTGAEALHLVGGGAAHDHLQPVDAQVDPVIFGQRGVEVAGRVRLDEIGGGAGAQKGQAGRRDKGDQTGGNRRSPARGAPDGARGIGHQGCLGAVSDPMHLMLMAGFRNQTIPARARNSATISPASRLARNSFRELAPSSRSK